MPDLYGVLLFLHVTGAVLWVGGAAMHVALAALSRRTGSPDERVRLLELGDRLGPLLYIPSALVVLGAGIGLVLDGPWSFGDGWVVAGLGIYAAALALGFAFFLPQGAKLKAAVERHGRASAEVQEVVSRTRPSRLPTSCSCSRPCSS